jgi:hypothetical protein
MERIKLGDRLRISNPTKGVGWEVAGTGEGCCMDHAYSKALARIKA